VAVSFDFNSNCMNWRFWFLVCSKTTSLILINVFANYPAVKNYFEHEFKGNLDFAWQYPQQCNNSCSFLPYTAIAFDFKLF
jgi:hypothetical protein